MLVYIYESLRGFRKVFSHHSSWLLFSVLVLGFIGSSEIAGVSSFCRFWLLEVTGYHSLLRFFRSDTWSLLGLQEQWSRWVLAQNETVMVGQRVVLLGDHTKVPKMGLVCREWSPCIKIQRLKLTPFTFEDDIGEQSVF